MTAPSGRLRMDAVFITGNGGTGKSTLGRSLQIMFGRPSLEVGVMLRLLALCSRGGSSRRQAGDLWNWVRTGRLDVLGGARLGLSATVPRLDGRTFERELWTEISLNRLEELRSDPLITDVLREVVLSLSKREVAVVVGRDAPPENVSPGMWIHLEAEQEVCELRKRRQLARVLGRIDPSVPLTGLAFAAVPDAVVDSTTISVDQVLSLVVGLMPKQLPARVNVG